MRVILFVIVLFAVVGVLVADGVSMYGAHQTAVNFSNVAAEQAVQTHVVTKGNEAAVRAAIMDMATDQGVELVDVTYHQGTTRWYEVTVRAVGASFLLRHLPFVKNHLAQQSTAIAHF